MHVCIMQPCIHSVQAAHNVAHKSGSAPHADMPNIGPGRPADLASLVEAAWVAEGQSGPGIRGAQCHSGADKDEQMVKRRALRADSADLSLRGRIGAHVLHAHYDSRMLTAPARAAFLASFEREVDPDGLLPAEERRRRAAHLRAAHFVRLARLSAVARRRRTKRQRLAPDSA